MELLLEPVPWAVGSHAPAPGAGLQLPVTLRWGSAFRGTRDSPPVAGCWLSRDSAAESPSVSAVSAVPGRARRGQAVLPLAQAAPLPSGVGPVQPRQPPPGCAAAALAPPGSQPKSPVWLIWISLAFRDPIGDNAGLAGAGFIPSLIFPHNTGLFLQPVIPALLVASPLPPGCSLELGGSSSSSLPAGARSPGRARGTGCCQDAQRVTEQPVSRAAAGAPCSVWLGARADEGDAQPVWAWPVASCGSAGSRRGHRGGGERGSVCRPGWARLAVSPGSIAPISVVPVLGSLEWGAGRAGG